MYNPTIIIKNKFVKKSPLYDIYIIYIIIIIKKCIIINRLYYCTNLSI